MKKPKKNFSPGESPQVGKQFVREKSKSCFLSPHNLLILALVFISYGASLFNGYALDDFIVLVKNKYVQSGFSGIGKIFSQDTFAGMTEGNIMVAGRKSPVSLYLSLIHI